jgi:copper homeostasis protein
MGVERILTSGQSLRAVDGIATYRALMQLEKCPTLLAGGGVSADAVSQLAACGITEVHFSARKAVHGSIGRGIFDPAYETVDPEKVSAMRAALEAVNRHQTT